jgi:hypothetical protein
MNCPKGHDVELRFEGNLANIWWCPTCQEHFIEHSITEFRDSPIQLDSPQPSLPGSSPEDDKSS